MFDFYDYDLARGSLLTPRYPIQGTDYYIPSNVLILNNPSFGEKAFVNQVTYLLPKHILENYGWITDNINLQEQDYLSVKYRGVEYLAVPFELHLDDPLGTDIVQMYANKNILLKSILMTKQGIDKETEEINRIAGQSLPILSREPYNA